MSESTKSELGKLFFSPFMQKQLEIHDGTKNRLNTLSYQLLGGSLEVSTKYTLFYKQRFFFNSASVLLFSWIELQMLLRDHTETILIFTICLDLGLFMLYLSDLFFIFIIIFTMINHIISWMQTKFFFLLIF